MLFIKAEEESALNYTVHKVVLNNAAEKIIIPKKRS